MIIVISILFTTFLILGIKIASNEGMVLYPFKLKIEELELKIFKPLFLCVWCMPTFWSLAGWGFTFLYLYFTTGNIELKYLLFYPITIAGSSFLSGILWTLLEIFIKINNNN